MEDTYDKRQAEVLPFTTVSLRTQANLYSVCCVCGKRSVHFNTKGIIHAYAKKFLIMMLFYNNSPNNLMNRI